MNNAKEYAVYSGSEVTSALLDSIVVGDLVKVNDWKKPLRVKGVSENHFVMATKQFGKTLYSVCEKKPWPGVKHNEMTGGMFHVGRDFWLFGWSGWDRDYDFDNPIQTAEYLASFEDETAKDHSELSQRNAVPIYTLYLKRACRAKAKNI